MKLAVPSRRFPPPWSVEVTQNNFIVWDANSRALKKIGAQSRKEKAAQTSGLQLL
jgi:hypothetical protein